jgi:transcriptional regulator with PAS, ATPase and Fis domain
MRPPTIAVCTKNLLATAVRQQTTAKPPAEIHAGHQVVSRVPANMLAEFNGSLQELASKVSPAVVQIEVTRFGPAHDEDRKDSVVMVHQHELLANASWPGNVSELQNLIERTVILTRGMSFLSRVES